MESDFMVSVIIITTCAVLFMIWLADYKSKKK